MYSFICGSSVVIIESTELLAFSATLCNKPPLETAPLTQVNSPLPGIGSPKYSSASWADWREGCALSIELGVVKSDEVFSPLKGWVASVGAPFIAGITGL